MVGYKRFINPMKRWILVENEIGDVGTSTLELVVFSTLGLLEMVLFLLAN